MYLACILLVGAVVMLAEFALGRRSRVNMISAYKAVRPNLAMTRSIIETGMERIADSIERHKQGLC